MNLQNEILKGLIKTLEKEKNIILDELSQELNTFERIELIAKKKSLVSNINDIKKEIKR